LVARGLWRGYLSASQASVLLGLRESPERARELVARWDRDQEVERAFSNLRAILASAPPVDLRVAEPATPLTASTEATAIARGGAEVEEAFARLEASVGDPQLAPIIEKWLAELEAEIAVDADLAAIERATEKILFDEAVAAVEERLRRERPVVALPSPDEVEERQPRVAKPAQDLEPLAGGPVPNEDIEVDPHTGVERSVEVGGPLTEPGLMHGEAETPAEAAVEDAGLDAETTKQPATHPIDAEPGADLDQAGTAPDRDEKSTRLHEGDHSEVRDDVPEKTPSVPELMEELNRELDDQERTSDMDERLDQPPQPMKPERSPDRGPRPGDDGGLRPKGPQRGPRLGL
ncbi:MAG: hypothetical protein ACREEC_06825, partial [Thermoplasmata archaeon]